MRATVPVMLLLLATLAGCLDAGDPPAAAPAAEAVQETPVLVVAREAEPEAVAPEPREAPDDDGHVRWSGANLTGAPYTASGEAAIYQCWLAGRACATTPPECTENRCERRAFEVRVPEDHWDAHEGALVASVRWPIRPEPMFDVWIEDAAGAVVAFGPNAFVATTGQTAVLPSPAPGWYTVVVAARHGTSEYEAAVRLESRPAGDPGRDLLPDLVVLPPSDLTLETPDYAGVSYFAFPVPGVREAAEAAGTRGCRVDEVVETSGKRCLRFSTAIGNLGEGPLDVRLPPGATAFTQRVHRADGSFAEHAGGAAEWHATHAHWHNAAANRYTVHPFDLATQTRGEPVSEGKKGGICFADTGIVDVGLPIMRAPGSPGGGCLEPATEQAWWMGISPGWYDLYPFLLSDQYVELEGVPDGVYQLCAAINTEGTLREADAENNETCTTFRLTGNEVEMLSEEPYHTIRGGV